MFTKWSFRFLIFPKLAPKNKSTLPNLQQKNNSDLPNPTTRANTKAKSLSLNPNPSAKSNVSEPIPFQSSSSQVRKTTKLNTENQEGIRHKKRPIFCWLITWITLKNINIDPWVKNVPLLMWTLLLESSKNVILIIILVETNVFKKRKKERSLTKLESEWAQGR